MNYLKYQDWQVLFSAIETLHSDFDPQTLAERTLTAASTVVAADSAAFTAFNWEGGYADLMWTNGDDYSPAEMEVFAAHIHENPLFDEFIVKHRAETLKITDLMHPEKFARTGIYNEFYRRVGVSNQLVAPMRITDGLLITCSINIEHSDFTGRDKTALDFNRAASRQRDLQCVRLSASERGSRHRSLRHRRFKF